MDVSKAEAEKFMNAYMETIKEALLNEIKVSLNNEQIVFCCEVCYGQS